MMPKPPVVWYTDSDAVPIKEVIVNCDTDEKQKDRLSRITDLMKINILLEYTTLQNTIEILLPMMKKISQKIS